MPCYVDSPVHPFGRMLMCHLIADTPTELFAMADQLGLKRSWYQPVSFPHFDLAKGRRAQALRLGAIPLDRRALAERMRLIRSRADWPDAWKGPP